MTTMTLPADAKPAEFVYTKHCYTDDGRATCARFAARPALSDPPPMSGGLRSTYNKLAGYDDDSNAINVSVPFAAAVLARLGVNPVF